MSAWVSCRCSGFPPPAVGVNVSVAVPCTLLLAQCMLGQPPATHCPLKNEQVLTLPQQKLVPCFFIHVLMYGLQQPASSSLYSSSSVWITGCVFLSLSSFQVFCLNSTLQHFEVPRFSYTFALIIIQLLYSTFSTVISVCTAHLSDTQDHPGGLIHYDT